MCYDCFTCRQVQQFNCLVNTLLHTSLVTLLSQVHPVQWRPPQVRW
jgi:hypothetical protein